eukprot:scaffold83065_cov68-Cyclotella_meneghiniana.AAC.1
MAIRKFIRKAIRDSFQTIDPADPSTHHITLEQLEFKTLAHFLSTLSRRSPKPPSKAMAKTLCCHISPETTPVNVTSSLANLFKECKVARDVNETVKKDLWATVAIYKKGAARDAAKQKKQYGLRTSEGKDPMPFAAYEHLCHILHQSRDPQHIAAHLFLTLDWNMLS